MTGRLVLAALSAAGIVACCSSSPPVQNPHANSCCVAKIARIDPRFTAAERIAIDDAMEAWFESSEGRLCIWTTASWRYDFVIVRADSADDFLPFTDHTEALLGYWSRGTITLRTNAVDHSMWPTLVSHELGHLAGLVHADDDEESVMHPMLTMAMPGGRIPVRDVNAFMRVNDCH